MKIGLLSDTHGMADRAHQAANLFTRQGIDTILHCGDVGSLAVLEQFVGKHLWFVWGNVDRPALSWQAAVETWGFIWPETSPLAINLDGKRIILAHGHEAGFRQALRNPAADFLFCGHSHERLCVRIGRCMVVNPGAIQRTSLPTVAIVDLQTADMRFLDLDGKEVSS